MAWFVRIGFLGKVGGQQDKCRGFYLPGPLGQTVSSSCVPTDMLDTFCWAVPGFFTKTSRLSPWLTRTSWPVLSMLMGNRIAAGFEPILAGLADAAERRAAG